MLWDYARKLTRFGFTDFAVRTDLINGLVSLAISLLAGPKNKPVTTLTTHDVAIYAIYALGAYILIRALIVGPYQLWKREREETDAAYDRLSAPEHAIEKGMADHKIAAYKELATLTAKVILISRTSTEAQSIYQKANETEIFIRAIEIMEELRSSVTFRKYSDGFYNKMFDMFREEDRLKRKHHADKITELGRYFIQFLHEGA